VWVCLRLRWNGGLVFVGVWFVDAFGADGSG
jgi:hypothetical protein